MTDSFLAIKYVTSQGEKCVATRSNDIVTISGDQNGTRKMPIGLFMKEFINDQSKANIKLERSPQNDAFSMRYRKH